jgi:hypothetical protein
LVSFAPSESGRLCRRASCLPAFLSAAVLKLSFHDPCLIFSLVLSSLYFARRLPRLQYVLHLSERSEDMDGYVHDRRQFPKFSQSFYVHVPSPFFPFISVCSNQIKVSSDFCICSRDRHGRRPSFVSRTPGIQAGWLTLSLRISCNSLHLQRSVPHLYRRFSNQNSYHGCSHLPTSTISHSSPTTPSRIIHQRLSHSTTSPRHQLTSDMLIRWRRGEG